MVGWGYAVFRSGSGEKSSNQLIVKFGPLVWENFFGGPNIAMYSNNRSAISIADIALIGNETT